MISPSNTEAEISEKTRAYLAAGAQEVWIVTEAGDIHYFDASGEKQTSRFPVTLNPQAHRLAKPWIRRRAP